LTRLDREEALKDDFHFDSETYGYDNESEEWDDESKWDAEGDPEEEASDAKDSSAAYLDFLNEEVRFILLYGGFLIMFHWLVSGKL
jgi:importin-7